MGLASVMPLLVTLVFSLLSAASGLGGAARVSGHEGPDPAPEPLEEASEVDWSRNLGDLVLDAEHELLGEVVLLTPDRTVTFEEGYRTLARLIDEASERLPSPGATGLEPLDTLRTIDHLLADEGFSYRDYSSPENTLLGYHTLSFGLARRELDCAMYTFVYLAIAEALDLPLSGMSLPEHLTLCWNLSDGSHVNWEATVGKTCSDEFYLRWKRLSSSTVQRGVYLRPLSKQEMYAAALYEKGLVLKERRREQRALAVTRQALALAPRSPDLHNLAAMLAAKRGDHAEALLGYDRALALDEAFAHALYNRAGSELALGRSDDARATLDLLRGLAPSFAERLECRLERESGPTSARSDRRP